MKAVWLIAYSKEKELCKNSQYPSRKKYELPSGWIEIMSKFFFNILDFSLLIAKRIIEKFSSVFL